MTWFVHLIPNECDSISVLINNEYWKRWFRTSGDQTWMLPPRFQGLSELKIGATVAPEGKNGTIEVKWDGRVVRTLNFDNYEDQSVNNHPPVQDHDHGHGPLIAAPDLTHEGAEDETTTRTSPSVRPLAFSSGVLTNKSNTPEIGVDSVSLPVANDLMKTGAESKTFRKWSEGGGIGQAESDKRWVLRSAQGTDLASMEYITVTLLRARDPQTQVMFVQGILGFRQSSHGWHIPYLGTAQGGLRMKIWFLNSKDGVLEPWDLTDNQVVDCGDSGAYFEFKKNLSPDWYDIVSAALIIIEPNTWYSCG